MATSITSTGITFPDATSQTTAVTDISDLNSNISDTELGYLNGVTSAIQTQLDGKLTGNQTITLSGDASGSGTTSISVSLAANVVGASELNVTGNGTSGQFLSSDGDGTMTWATVSTTPPTAFNDIGTYALGGYHGGLNVTQTVGGTSIGTGRAGNGGQSAYDFGQQISTQSLGCTGTWRNMSRFSQWNTQPYAEYSNYANKGSLWVRIS